MIETHLSPPQPLVRASDLPRQLTFAGGLTPFANARHFALRTDPNAAPFLRMDSTEMDLGFVLIDPFLLLEDYRPEFMDADVQDLKLSAKDKPLVLAIVNLSRGIEEATANLAGPLLINPSTGEGRQVVLVNANQYQVRHRLLQS